MEKTDILIDRNSDEIAPILANTYTKGMYDYHVEQLIFRIYCCRNCFKEKKCKFCMCNPYDKIKEPISCNPKVFPGIMNKFLWEDYKAQHNITIR